MYVPDDNPRIVDSSQLYIIKDPSIRLGGYSECDISVSRKITNRELQEFMKPKHENISPKELKFSIMNTKKYSYSDLIELLGLPKIVVPNKHIIVSMDHKYTNDTSNKEIKQLIGQLSMNDLDIFRKCIYNRKGQYSRLRLKEDFQHYQGDLDNLLKIIFILSDIDHDKLLVLM